MDGGLIRWALESLVALLKGARGRRQPLFRQADRLLKAFEAHGVPPHQLPRLMPQPIQFEPQHVTSSVALINHLRFEHLDWASQLLAIRRDWLDLEVDQPHHEVNVYKNPRKLYKWLEERAAIRSGRMASIHVLTEDAFDDPSVAHGRFVLIYEEAFAEMEDKSLSRYWYLSVGSHFEHPSCVIDLLGILTIAEHFILLPCGHAVPAAVTSAAEAGKLGLIPLVLKGGKRWHPQDWVPVQYLSANCKTQAHRDYWEQTREKLTSEGLRQVLNLGRYTDIAK